jgi:Ca2+-binding EF-hand superfamily protein
MPAVHASPDFFRPTFMKRPGLTSSLIAATLFLAIGLRAEDAKTDKSATAPAAGMKRGGRRDAEMLKRFDKNGDGKIDDNERAEAKDLVMREQMDRQAARAAAVAPAPKPAEVGKPNAEKEKMAAANSPAPGANPGAAMRAELIRNLDKNGDGKIDEVERADGIYYLSANIEKYPAMKQRFDRNNDGKLDDRERIALDEGLQQIVSGVGPMGPGMRPGRDGPMPLEAMPPAMREQAVKRFDKDGDGKLAEAELAAMQSEMTRRRQERERMGPNGRGGPMPAAPQPVVVDKEAEAKLNQTMEEFAARLDFEKQPEKKP